MKYLLLLVFTTLSCINSAKAESIVLFDAEKHCQARSTSTGVLYVPPCKLPIVEFSFTSKEKADISKQASLVTYFQCHSLRPLSLRYQLIQNQEAIMEGNLAASRNLENAKSTFPIKYSSESYSFILTELEGAIGFQAMKPGCKFAVETDVITDVSSLPALAKIHIAILESSNQAILQSDIALFKNEIRNIKYLLETIKSLIETNSFSVINLLDSSISKVTAINNDCSNIYCNSAALAAIEEIYTNSEQELDNINQLLNSKLENYDSGNEELNDDIRLWLSLRALIKEALLP